MADYIVMSMRDGDTRTLKAYIESLASINEHVYKDEENSLTLLHLATGIDSEHRESIIELLIGYRADLNCPGISEGVDQVRPLHLAAMWGYDLAVKLLLYHGADASLRDSSGLSAVDYASIFDNYLCISLLLRYGSLNSTATAWSAIMDSSLGESNADSSFENCLYATALDLGNSVIDENGNESDKQDKLSHLSSILSEIERSTNAKLFDQDYDPLDDVKEDDVNLDIDNRRLRLELRRLGRDPGPIVQTTKRLYCKLLAHLIKEDEKLVYSPRTTTRCELNGFSVELNSILTGKFPIKQALDLEKEFLRISNNIIYHGPKQYFNYILIDPRISQDLPMQALDANDSDTSYAQLSSPEAGDYKETPKPKDVMRRVNRGFNVKLFTKFMESIFYIGKGQKKRDFDHLLDALADRNSITKSKIERIRSIWADGYGVVSLHLFHNITSKEALTREALMIETVGLNNLTNLLNGTVQFRLGWNEHKRRLLGALFLERAYSQLLNDGERQLRKEDLKIDKNNKLDPS